MFMSERRREMDRQKMIKQTEELKLAVDEIWRELNSYSPRVVYLKERIKHLNDQVKPLQISLGLDENEK